ncbi:MAG: aminotransferase class V-fold PLP-dependent enzyme, partial [Acidobacteriota bacterium]
SKWGLALITVSERMLEKAKTIGHRGYYTDVVNMHKKHQASGTPTTPAIPQIWALQKQLEYLESETMEGRWARHHSMRSRTEAWAADTGFTYASDPSGASPTVSCLKPPEGITAPDLVKGLAERGITVGGGYGAWKPETFRIGHMGEVQLDDLKMLFDAIEDLLP